MTSYFVRRLLLMIPTFIGITIVSFVVMHFVPGGPIERQLMAYKMAVAQEGGGGSLGQFGVEISPEAVEQMKEFYGFDKPVLVRYGTWLWNVVRLDLGTSYIYQDPVWDVIKSRFPVSIFLGLTGFFCFSTTLRFLGTIQLKLSDRQEFQYAILHVLETVVIFV